MHLEVLGVVMACQAQTKAVGTKGKGQRPRSDSVLPECADRAGGKRERRGEQGGTNEGRAASRMGKKQPY